MSEEDNKIDIIDPENYRSGNLEPLHVQMVRIAMVKTHEASCVEMREGYRTLKRDKFGNEIPVSIPDTRLTLLECIETLRMSMGVDMDDEAEEKLKEIEDDLKDKLDKYLELEKNEWLTASPIVKMEWKKRGLVYLPDRLNKSFFFYNEYLLDKVAAYRKIYVELDKLADRKDYWRGETIIG